VFKESTLCGDGGELKFGGRRKARGADGLLGAVVIGALVAFLVAGTWAATDEMERQRGAGFVGSRWGFHVNPTENGEWIMSEDAIHICSLNRFPVAGDREANSFRNQTPGSNGRADFSAGGMSSRCERVAGLPGISGDASAIPTALGPCLWVVGGGDAAVASVVVGVCFS